MEINYASLPKHIKQEIYQWLVSSTGTTENIIESYFQLVHNINVDVKQTQGYPNYLWTITFKKDSDYTWFLIKL